MLELELAWAAGFFDGEGSTCNGNAPNGRLQLQMQVVQVDRRPLDRFLAAVEAGTIYGPYQPRQAHWQPKYRWIVRGIEEVTGVAAKLFPYLSEPKQEQMLAEIQRNLDNLEERKVTNPPGRKAVTHG